MDIETDWHTKIHSNIAFKTLISLFSPSSPKIGNTVKSKENNTASLSDAIESGMLNTISFIMQQQQPFLPHKRCIQFSSDTI